MKYGKKLAVCLLAAVLALAVLTACSGSGGGIGTAAANAYTSREGGEALAETMGLTYDADLQAQASIVANWLVNSTAIRQGADHLVCKVALSDDTNSSHQDNLSDFLDWSGCIGVPMDAVIALKLQPSENNLVPASLYVPQLAGADVALQDYAGTSTTMGAAFIDCNGTTYVVAVFQ